LEESILSFGGWVMKFLRPILVAAILFALYATSDAVVFNGGKGLPHTKAAWVTETGRLTVLSHTRFWGQVHQTPDSKAGISTAVTVWDVRGQIALNYGLGKHFGLLLTPVLFQDDQSEWGQYPWDTHLALKIGDYGSKASSLRYGLELNARFPTGDSHNVLFEDYTAGSTEFGAMGLMSYAYDPLYPEDALNLHFNLGYINHNDAGENLTGIATDQNSEVLQQSQQGLYALAMSIPTESFDYGFELYGNYWLQEPPLAAAGRETYLYMGGSIKYKPLRWFDFIVSGDYRLSADNDDTVGPRRAPSGIPNYNTWRLNVGAKFVLLPTSIYRLKERDVLMQKAETRRELFEQIIKERRETESAEEELERIREERRKAERELERLRRILEGQSEENNTVEEMRKRLEPEP
jgi:hypothetical protein